VQRVRQQDIFAAREATYIYFVHLLLSRQYAVFRFVLLRDRIFIIYLLMTWPEYLFPKKTP
jgi:hypothetical protein